MYQHRLRSYLDLSLVLADRPDPGLVDDVLLLGNAGLSLFDLLLDLLSAPSLGLLLELSLHADLDDRLYLPLLHLLLDLRLVLVVLQTPDAVLKHLQLKLSLPLLLQTLQHHSALVH